MSIVSGIANFFSGVWRAVKKIIAEALPKIVQILLAEVYKVALEICLDLAETDFSNEEKREKAFQMISEKLRELGKTASTSFINFVIELAVQNIKNLQGED